MTEQTDHTPMTEQIREFIEAADRVVSTMAPGGSAVDAFDRWLAAHDAQVRAEALREAAEKITRDATVDECALHAVARVAQLPQPSRMMLNGVTRAAERLREMAGRAAVPSHTEGNES